MRAVADHGDALAYDFRHRFHLPLSAIFDGTVGYRDGWALIQGLAVDMGSHYSASLNGWDYPLSYEAFALASTYDLLMAANADPKKRRGIKPFPKPWPDKDTTQSAKPTVDQATVIRMLEARGHPTPPSRGGAA